MGAIVFATAMPEFSMMRGYARQVVILSTFATEPIVSGYQVSWDSSPGYSYVLAFEPKFWDWSSNSYTLDRVLDLPNSSIDCHFFPCFDQVDVNVSHIINDDGAVITLRTFATTGSQRAIALPPPPSGYWARGWD